MSNGDTDSARTWKLIVTTATITLFITGGLFTAAWQMLSPYDAAIEAMNTKIDRANQTLMTIQIQQAVISSKIDTHINDTGAHDPTHR